MFRIWLWFSYTLFFTQWMLYPDQCEVSLLLFLSGFLFLVVIFFFFVYIFESRRLIFFSFFYFRFQIHGRKYTKFPQSSSHSYIYVCIQICAYKIIVYCSKQRSNEQEKKIYNLIQVCSTMFFFFFYFVSLMMVNYSKSI